MSALFTLVAAIGLQPAVKAAALSQDAGNAEFARLFSATCEEMGLDDDGSYRAPVAA